MTSRMLPAHVADLWSRYLAAEESGVRRSALLALSDFISALTKIPRGEWTRWAKDLVARVSDEHEPVPLRFPLLLHVVVPALTEGVVGSESGCARWLAHVWCVSYSRCPELELQRRFQSPAALLEEALRVDPGDVLARLRLIAMRAEYLLYTVHEVPCGVLFSGNGASIAECEELLQFLAAFEQEVAIAGQTSLYGPLVSECRFHYQMYSEYLRSEWPHGGYAEYLEFRSAG